MDLFIYRYYKKGMDPFRTISSLADKDIPLFMEKYFPNHSWFHADPSQRVAERRRIEQWLFEEFTKMGGKPTTHYPVYFAVGPSSFLKNFESFEGESDELKLPLSLFSSENISFTYPDSFFSDWLCKHRDHPLYNESLNGQLFSMEDLIGLMKQQLVPISQSVSTSRYDYPFYIEAQVWDYRLLKNPAS